MDRQDEVAAGLVAIGVAAAAVAVPHLDQSGLKSMMLHIFSRRPITRMQ